jgi:acetyltransferase
VRTGAALSALFEPRSVAVVGASASPGKAGNAMMRSLLSFPGSVYPINPRAGEVEGRVAYPKVSAVPEPVELAVIVVPPFAVPDALRDCASAGVRAAVICSGGMGESGPEGTDLQEEARKIARDAGIRVLGPNTSGFVVPALELAASFVPGAGEIPAGTIAIVAQSGGVNHALAFAAQNEGVGVRLAVGLGNAMDVTAADVVEHLAEDEGTRAIALHLEGVSDGRKLFEAVERAAPKKPVVALKVGRADVGEFARSHTGALTGSWRLARSALAQAGAVVVEDTTELLDATRALSAYRLPSKERPGIAVVSGQAGPALIIADSLRSAGVELPELGEETVERLGELLPPLTYQRNPVDTGRPGETFAGVLATVGDDPSVDAVAIYALHEPGALDPGAALKEMRARTETPTVFVTGGPREVLGQTVRSLDETGVPVYLAPERGARAVRALAADARAARRRGHREEAPPPAVPNIGPEPLDEAAAKDLLDALGVKTPRRRACATREEAREAMSELGGRVVMKVLDPAITHKSDVGGVHVGVASDEAMKGALDAIDGLTSRDGPRYLVEEMVGPGVELIVGGTRDASFGPTVLLGLGGVAAEAIGDLAVRLAPLSAGDADEIIGELSGKKLLEGFRGQPAADRDELVGLLLAVSGLLLARPEIAELDVNPVRVTAEGLVALDALILHS